MAEVSRAHNPKRRKPTVGKSTRASVNVSPRLDKLLSGELSVEDLHDDEIRRMQLHDKNGSFSGNPPIWIPRDFALALQSEHRRRFAKEMAEMIPEALDAIKELVTSKRLQPGDATRLKAAQEIIERNFGKVTASAEMHVVVDKGKSFDELADEVLVIEEVE